MLLPQYAIKAKRMKNCGIAGILGGDGDKDSWASHDGWFWSNPVKNQCVGEKHQGVFIDDYQRRT